MTDCVCVRREDVDPLQSFISILMSGELSIMADFGRKKTEMIRGNAPEDVILEEEIRAKAEVHHMRLREYERFISNFPHLCSAASKYL